MNRFAKGALAAALAAAFVNPAQAFDLNSFTNSANKAVDQAQKDANDAANKTQSSIDNATNKSQTAVNSASGNLAVAGDTASLVNTLSGKLGVSNQQAAGGTAALFALAQSKMPSSEFSGITNKVSGLSGLLGSGGGSGSGSNSSLTGTILNNVSSLGGVKTAFSSLGMSSGMIGEFTPIITQFLGTQGVSGTVVNALQGLWTPAG